ncbi:MAG: bifunctional folylpolyglutamate synthase/dihydrofolate synthase, partial [Oscillospiraceae bacterium]
MNSEQALQYIHGIYRRGKKDGLKRITELLDLLGNPQDSLRFIHVAGTNGKGSVCVMLSKILELSG